jgi:ubiquinone/menaquinone biosynthesis C-methylase UbiE
MLYKRTETYPRIYGLGDRKESVVLRSRLALQKFVTKGWYQVVSLMADRDLTFMNFGYAPEGVGSDLKLEQEDERNRDTIQLYRRVASTVKLSGKQVLEVGSGRGGGSAYIQKYLGPQSMTGVDFCGRAVAFCQKRHVARGLTYVQGDAEDLPFSSESFDAVVNVESCHCYLSVDKFLAQVVRVLRPGGNFLITDMGPKPYVDALRAQLGRCGLKMVEEEDISSGVVQALSNTSERNARDIKAQVPWGLRKVFSNFAGIKDTPVFNALSTGEWEYVRFVMQKA